MAQAKTRRRPGLERVVATADRLFYEEGIRATGVDRIAAEANVSKATMYTYFATKDDLVAEYLDGRSRAWQRHVADQLSRHGGSPRDRILRVFELLQEWFDSADFHGCPFINAEAECSRESRAHEVNLGHRAWVRGLFQDLLTEAEIRPEETLALQLCVLYDGSMASAAAEPGPRWGVAAREAARALTAHG